MMNDKSQTEEVNVPEIPVAGQAQVPPQKQVITKPKEVVDPPEPKAHLAYMAEIKVGDQVIMIALAENAMAVDCFSVEEHEFTDVQAYRDAVAMAVSASKTGSSKAETIIPLKEGGEALISGHQGSVHIGSATISPEAGQLMVVIIDRMTGDYSGTHATMAAQFAQLQAQAQQAEQAA